MDVAVIGGGFWGSAVSRLLVEHGVEHVVVDDAHPLGASRNAAGICKLSWYRQDTVRKMIDGVFSFGDFTRGFDWLQAQVKIQRTPETFINAVRETMSTHHDNYLADPLEFLVPTIHADVPRLWIEQTGVRLGGTDIVAKDVVVCAGARTDTFLEASKLGRPTGVSGLLGRAIRFDASNYATSPECVTVMTRPYVHYTYRHLNGQIRGGDTVERTRDDKRLASLIALAHARYDGVGEITEFGGIRPVCKRMFIDRVHPRVIAATGGHRVGFGLAGAVAHRVVELL